MDSSSGDVKINITEPQPAIPPGIQPTQTEDPQTEATNNHHHGGAFAKLPVDSDKQNAQRGENYGDSSGKLWTMYLNETEKEDKEITENWKVDTEGILVFLKTGLFSATVASFIIESYKQLSPDSSVTTNTLLTQISRQLANTSNRDTSCERYNAALQTNSFCRQGQRDVQWARRYLQLAQHRGAPHKRARLRAYIFDGIQGFGMTRAIEAMPALLHLSVFLFFAGLVDFLIPINTTVAYFTLGWIALFAAAYAILTILPNLRLNCPYRTPLSGITWRLSQFSDSGPTKWRETLEDQVTMRRTWLKDGLRKSVELSATGAPPAVDKGALEWTLTALDEDKEFEDFAEHLPGFFDSKAVPNPTSAILPLMADQLTTDPILGSRLRDLLKTCIPGTSPLSRR
ncbi:hypothetical protein EDB86DRAFT_2832266 [Lactarius hatsudake]|nr:hypothetical protein EDB86DRAFT_2832266 [Lactarius hatsudake]